MGEIREALIGDGTLKVTSDGKVFTKRPKCRYDKSELEWREICTKYCEKSKYLSAWIHYEDGTKEIKRVHRIIAEAFIPNPFPDVLNEINHIDGNKSNNRVDNLEWTTKLDNIREAHRLGLLGGKKIHYCEHCGKPYYYTYPPKAPLYLCEDCKAVFREKYRKSAPQEEQARVRSEVEKACVVQADIARVTGLDESTVSYWLRGKRNLRAHNLEKIEKFLSEREASE